VIATKNQGETMLGFFNYNKPSVDILRDLIYASNGFMLPASGVLYDTPLAVTPLVADRYQRDSVIKVQMDPTVPYQQWRGHRTFLYKRLNFADLIPNVPWNVTPTPIPITTYPTNVYALLPQINAYYGLQLTEADVLNTSFASSAATFQMTAAPGSVSWEGTTYLPIQGYTPPTSGSGSGGSGSDGTGGTGSGGTGGSDGSSGSGGSGSDGTGSDGTGGSGSGSDGTGGSGSGSGGAGTDGTDPAVGPDWEPNGESGVQDDSQLDTDTTQ
jgi:hypothetical protein